jgi:hypothetical protein
VPAAGPGPRHIELHEGVQIAGYYRTESACQRSGRFGERNAYWDRYSCDRVRVGHRRGAWALQAASDDDWDRLGFAVPLDAVGHFPARYRPVWVGQFRPGRPGPGVADRGRPGSAHQPRERAGFGSARPVTPITSDPRKGTPVKAGH